MKKLEKSIIDFFENQKIDLNGNQFLLACSGGKDSMVLAHALKKLKINFGLAHCNFQLRSKDSNLDENFVQDFALKNEIPFFTRSFQTKNLAQENGKSIQMMARELRYAFFEEIVKANSYDFILTAHHLDDSLETQMINLSRGTGIKGLQGIPPKNEKILRPLHLCTRYEMDEYQNSLKINWREDISNASDNYQRNYIRHHISPLLKKSSSSFEKGYLQSLKNIQSDVDLYQFLLKKIKKEISIESKGGLDIDLKKLEDYPSKTSLLKNVLEPFGFQDLSAIERSNSSISGKEFESENYHALVNRGFLLIRKKAKTSTKNYFIQGKDKRITNPLALQFDQIEPSEIDLFNLAEQSAAFDFDKLQFPLEIRKWKKGDRFQPLGMNQSKKLSDFFIDQKVSTFDKSACWLLCSGDVIIWIIGMRINELYKITELTKTAYFVRPLK